MKEHADLVSIAEGAGVELKRSGTRHIGRCPFHDDRSPSFFVFQDQKFRCFGCNEYGDVIDFIQKFYDLSFPDALKHLGIEQGRITQKMKRSIDKQKRKSELIKKFRKWEHRYAADVGNLIFKTEKLMANGIPPEELDLYAPLLHGLSVWEHHLDIIIHGTDEE